MAIRRSCSASAERPGPSLAEAYAIRRLRGFSVMADAYARSPRDRRFLQPLVARHMRRFPARSQILERRLDAFDVEPDAAAARKIELDRARGLFAGSKEMASSDRTASGLSCRIGEPDSSGRGEMKTGAPGGCESAPAPSPSSQAKRLAIRRACRRASDT